MKSSLRTLSIVVCFAALLLTSAPLAAAHLDFNVTRSPAGGVLAGTRLTVTANAINTSDTLDFFDATLNTVLLNPDLFLIPGTVETRYVEQDVPSGTVLSGNDPLDREVEVEFDPIPPTWTAQVEFQLGVASFMAAGQDEVGGQVFLNFCHEGCQSVPWFLIIPVIAEPILDITKTDFGATVFPGQGVTYSLIVENIGTQEATGLTVTDTIPTGTRFDPTNSHPDWTCSPNHLPDAVCELSFESLGTQPQTFPFALITDPAPVPARIEHVHNTARVRDDGAGADQPRTDSDADTTPILAAPDLSVTKTDSGAIGQPSGSVAYDLAYTNHGTQDASGVVLQDTVPEHAQFDPAASTDGWTCQPASGPPGAICTLPIGSLPVGSSGSATFATTVAPTIPAGVDQLVNTATISDDGRSGDDLTPADNQATDTTPLAARPDLRLSKDDGGVTLNPGQSVAYTLTFDNVGSQGASGVLLRETVPDHSTFDPDRSSPGWNCSPSAGGPGATCTLDVGSLAAGASASTAFAVTVADTLSAGVDQLLNVATIEDDGTNGDDPTPANNRASDTTPIAAAPDLTVRKNDGGAVAQPGEVLLYTIDYSNAGTQTATGAFLREQLPEHTSFASDISDDSWTCTLDPVPACTLLLGNLAPGETGTATLPLRVNAQLPAGVDQLVNEIEIRDDGSNGPDTTPADNEDTETTPLDAAPDLVLTKDDDGATAAPGDTISYTLAYTNAGSQAATGVLLGDTVPDHATFAPEASDPGWTCDPSAGGPGATCLLELGELAAGATGSATFAVLLHPTVPAGLEEILNVALLQDDDANGEDLNPDDDGDQDTTPISAAPDLVLTKDDGGTTTAPGATTAYTLTYDNAGTQDATGVTLTETVPDHTTFAADPSDPGWTCDPSAGGPGATCVLELGELAVGATGSATFAVLLHPTVPAGLEEILNVALLQDDDANGEDLNPDDDGDQDTTPISAAPDLVLTKDDGGTTTAPGATTAYTLTYDNAGTQDATGVTLTETVPDHTTFAADPSDPGWTCDPSAGGPGATCVLELGELAVGATGTATFALTLDPELPPGVDRLTNTALLDDDGSNGDDLNPGDNEDADDTPVDATPDLVLAKDDAVAHVSPGDTIRYTLSYRNVGAQAASGVVLEDTVPPHSSFAPAPSDPGWACAPSAGGPGATCTLDLGELAAGASGTATFALVVDPNLPAGIERLTNTALLRDDGTNGQDPNPADNEASETTPVQADDPDPSVPTLDLFLSDLLAEDRDASGTVTPGDVLSYSVEVLHVAGDASALSPLFEVPIPQHTGFVPDSVRGGPGLTSSHTGDRLRVSLPDLPPGDRQAFAFDVVLGGELPENTEEIRAQGTITADTLSAHPSDDPDTTAPDDPTITPLGQHSGPADPLAIPTLGEYALALLALLLLGSAWRVLR
ncbi:MAG: IPTL-CTERM sorting domain-containing protein [bacterium]